MSFSNFVVFITVCISYLMAANVTDIKLKYLQYVLECATEHSVSTEDIRDLAKHRVVKGDNIKCMLACAYKKTGMTDEEGKLSAERMKEIAETAYHDDAEKKKKSEDFTRTCLYVNEEGISGERKECERAAKIFKCAIDNFDSAV
ncbi:general odorant-binding protein 19d-like [Cydia pomonella]|uniref:general odorant-binding protein 19d-like n=1 Tax=Cydia pomonella TaxID=82600 RepID=UPI002ADE5D7D|nr:general odorant-binding protein 19d-like [Cydia pomonella]